MTKEQEEREAKYNEFTYFGALRFALYLTAGIAFYAEALQVGAIAFICGSLIGLGRRLYHILVD